LLGQVDLTACNCLCLADSVPTSLSSPPFSPPSVRRLSPPPVRRLCSLFEVNFWLRFSNLYFRSSSISLLFFSPAARTYACLRALAPRRVAFLNAPSAPLLARGVFLPPLSFNASACAPRLCAPRFLLPASAGHPAFAWRISRPPAPIQGIRGFAFDGTALGFTGRGTAAVPLL